MPGRKKSKDSFNNSVTFKVTAAQKEILDKNRWIKDEIKNIIREHLDLYIKKQD